MIKVAFVTGSGVRIGSEICRQLHSYSYKIAIHYFSSSWAAYTLIDELNFLRSKSCKGFQTEFKCLKYG